MLTVPFSEFRQHSSQYIDAVESGESVTIIRHSRPVAQLVPMKKETGKIPSWKRPGLHLDKKFSLSEMVIKERDE